MPVRNSYTGKVFSGLISDRNTESKGMEEKQHRMREGQRSGLSKIGIRRSLVKKIITGR